jgi:Mg2+ and Co2+ transporter CorA
MNFKNIQGTTGRGVSVGLALIVISALLPLIWFKWKGWI